MITFQLGVCCIYMIFVADNAKDIIELHIEHIPVEGVMLIFIGPFILINCIPNLKIMAPFSILSLILEIIAFIMMLEQICQDLPPVYSRPLFTELKKIGMFFGTALFAVESLPVVSFIHYSKDF